MKVNVTDYRDLAFKHINALPLYRKIDVEEADLLNAAYLGIFLASKNFKEDKGTDFKAFCYWYIRQELSLLTHKPRTKEGKTYFERKVKEDLFEDVADISFPYDDALATNDYKDEMIDIDKFLKGLPLEGIELNFFNDMYTDCEKTAVINYREMTGNTRARAEQVKRKVKAKAKRYLERLERN